MMQNTRSVSPVFRFWMIGAGLIALAAWALPSLAAPTGTEVEEAEAVPAEEVPVNKGMVGALNLHYVQDGETMLDIAMKNRIGYVELVAANPDVDPWFLPEGTVVVLPEQHILPKDAGPGILVNLGDLRIYYFPPDGGPVKSYAISTGADAFETPVGIDKVTQLTKDPTWVPTENYHKHNPGTPKAIGPGPDNPLGAYRIRVGWDGYAIHGTNKPEGLGRRVSFGCVRMYPEDVEEFFQMLKVGTTVAITNQPVKFGWREGELYIEVHPFGDEIDQVEFGEDVLQQNIDNLDEMVFEAAGKDISRIDWTRLYAAVDERKGIPVRVTN